MAQEVPWSKADRRAAKVKAEAPPEDKLTLIAVHQANQAKNIQTLNDEMGAVEKIQAQILTTLGIIQTDLGWVKKILQGIMLSLFAMVGSFVFSMIKAWLERGGLLGN